MLSAAVQILAFALALLGVLGATVATLLPNWTVSASAWSSALAPVWRLQGLWMDCVCFGGGAFSCSVKNSPLSLPPHLQLMRAAMVLSCVLACFGLCLASLGLKCTRWGGGRRAKGHTAVAAGGCFLLAGVLCLAPASWFTREVVGNFLSTEMADSRRSQPGGALCVTFISAGFLLAGGVIFCLSCPGRRTGPSASVTPVRPDMLVPPRQEHNKPEEQRPPQPPLKERYSRQEYV